MNGARESNCARAKTRSGQALARRGALHKNSLGNRHGLDCEVLISRSRLKTPFSPTHFGAMPDTRKEKIALVLQGGGALGSYQAGAYAALQRADFKIDWVAGISIGAINGAIICGNPPSLRAERLERFWRQTSSWLLASPVTGDETSLRLFNETSAAMTAAFGVPGFFEPRMPPPIPGWPCKPGEVSVYDTKALRETLLTLVDFDLLNAGEIRYSIGAVNARSGNFQYFDTNYQKIGPEHVMASGALPPSFPANRNRRRILLGRRHRLEHAAAICARCRSGGRRLLRLPDRPFQRARRIAGDLAGNRATREGYSLFEPHAAEHRYDVPPASA